LIAAIRSMLCVHCAFQPLRPASGPGSADATATPLPPPLLRLPRDVPGGRLTLDHTTESAEAARRAAAERLSLPGEGMLPPLRDAPLSTMPEAPGQVCMLQVWFIPDADGVPIPVGRRGQPPLSYVDPLAAAVAVPHPAIATRQRHLVYFETNHKMPLAAVTQLRLWLARHWLKPALCAESALYLPAITSVPLVRVCQWLALAVHAHPLPPHSGCTRDLTFITQWVQASAEQSQPSTAHLLAASNTTLAHRASSRMGAAHASNGRGGIRHGDGADASGVSDDGAPRVGLKRRRPDGAHGDVGDGGGRDAQASSEASAGRGLSSVSVAGELGGPMRQHFLQLALADAVRTAGVGTGFRYDVITGMHTALLPRPPAATPTDASGVGADAVVPVLLAAPTSTGEGGGGEDAVVGSWLQLLTAPDDPAVAPGTSDAEGVRLVGGVLEGSVRGAAAGALRRLLGHGAVAGGQGFRGEDAWCF